MNVTTPIKLNNEFSERWITQKGKFAFAAWLVIVALILVAGWIFRYEGYLSAESGLGYALGILGCIFMLLLLTYSLRKRIPSLGRIMSIQLWFRLHMILGIVGPMLILFHSNFQLGSPNSTVALVCMLLVSGSGVIGRYLYQRTHFGLYGEKIRLKQVSDDLATLKKDLQNITVTPQQKKLSAIVFVTTEAMISKELEIDGNQRNEYSESTLRVFENLKKLSGRQLAKRISQAITKLTDEIEIHYRTTIENQSEAIQAHQKLLVFQSVLKEVSKKIPTLKLFDRLFSLWHVVHIPIFIVMLITALVHIVVVHMY